MVAIVKKRDRKALGEYVRWVANELELRDWVIELDRSPCDLDCAGYALCIDGQRHITIALAAGFRDYPPAEQRETIVHELLHAHTEACWRMVQTDLAEPLGKIAYYVFCDSYRRAMEYQVDALSKAIAPRLPLIDWPTRR
jgi:hypothetical protein